MATVPICPQQPLLLPAVLSELSSATQAQAAQAQPKPPHHVSYFLLHSREGDGGPWGKEH